MDAIVPSTSDFTGTGPTIATTTVSQGANEMGGSFALSFGGEVTDLLLYTADEALIEASLEVRNYGRQQMDKDSYCHLRSTASKTFSVRKCDDADENMVRSNQNGEFPYDN